MPLPFVYAQPATAAPVEIVVHGERTQPLAPARERQVSGSIVERERLTQPGVTVAQVLRDEPGAQTTELGAFGTWSSISLRGAPAAQTPVYLGALRLNDELGGAANLSDIPLFIVQRAELYRSHAPGFVEQLGVGGALVFEPMRPDRNQVTASITIGSYGYRSAQGFAAARSGERRVLAAVELTHADNDYAFPNSNGTLFLRGDDRVTRLTNADLQQNNVWLSVSDQVGRAALRVTYHRADREQGALKLAVTQAKQARVATGRDAVVLESAVPLDSLHGRLGLSTQAMIGETELFDPLSELSLAATRTLTRAQRVEQAGFLQHGILSGWQSTERVTLGFEGLQRFEERDSADSERSAATRTRARLSTSHRVRFGEHLSATALGSLASYTTSGALHQNAGSSGSAEANPAQKNAPGLEPEGRVGLSYRWGPRELFANAGHYRRSATLAELFGASLLVRGNPELRSERGTTFELGARQQWLDARCERRAWLDLGSFARFSQDLIVYDTTAQGYLLPRNRKQTRTMGAELSLGTRPLDFLTAELNLSFVDARDVSPGGLKNELLPFVSRATVSSLLAVEHSVDGAWVQRARLGVRANYKSSRYANQAGAGVIPEQMVFDLEAAATGVFDALTARLRVADVFDVARFDVVGFPLPRRSFYFALESTL